jgi:hypothetical protein
MRAAAYEVEKLATDGLTTADVDQFFRLAGIMIQNLNIERYGRNLDGRKMVQEAGAGS